MLVKKMTRIAMLSAVLYLGKVVLEFLPNVELVSLLTILYTLVFGREALVIVTVFNLFEMVQWGIGSWIVAYFYIWPLLSLLTLLLRHVLKEEFLLWAIFSGMFGLAFGALCALVYLPFGPAYVTSYWISGLPWDVTHAIGNFVIMLAVGKPLYRLLRYLKVRLPVE